MRHIDIIPKDKFDIESVRRLSETSIDEIENFSEVMNELFQWMQDINWPVALELSKALSKFGEAILPNIRYVLKSEDEQWKYSLLLSLIKELPKSVSLQLIDDIRRIADHPTEGEKLEETNDLAKEVLSFICK